MNTCSSCQHWHLNKYGHQISRDGFAGCAKLISSELKTEQQISETQLYAESGARIWTRPTFACNLWEGKP